MAKKKSKWLTVPEAARTLEVDRKTIRLWFKSGRLAGKKEKIVVERLLIDSSSLKDAFKSTCEFCGKVFESPHPEKAKFCCRQHRFKYRYHFGKEAAKRKKKAKKPKKLK